LTIRRLAPGDEPVVAKIAGGDPLDEHDAASLLADDRTLYLVAFDGEDPVGFVFAHDLRRRRGAPSHLFVYDVEVVGTHRRRGIGRSLMREVERYARERGIRTGFLVTNECNEAAMGLYGSMGGVRPNDDDVMWDFEYAGS